MRNRSGYKLNIFPLLAPSTEEPMRCRDGLLEQTKVLNISYKFLYTNRWLIRCRRRVESKVSGSLLCILPSRIMQSALQHLIMLFLFFGEKKFAHNRRSAKIFTFRCYRSRRATYQSFSENLHCKCFRMAGDDNISTVFFWAATRRLFSCAFMYVHKKEKFLREFLKRIYGQFSRCLFVQLIQEHIVR